jgi:hypothetical protein
MKKPIKCFCWIGNDGYQALKSVIFDFFKEKESLSLEELVGKTKELKEKKGLHVYIYSGDRSKAADFLTFVINRLQILQKQNELYELSNDARKLRKYQDENAFKRELLKLCYIKGEKKFTDFILLLKELLKKYKLFGKSVQKSNLRDTLRNYGLDSGGNKYMLPFLLSLGVMSDAGIYYEINPELLLFVDDLRLEILKKVLRDAYEQKTMGGKFFTYEDAIYTFTNCELDRDEGVEALRKLHDLNVFIIHQSGSMKILRM